MKKKASFWHYIVLSLVYIFLFAPIVVMIVFSFNSAPKSVTVFEGFSIEPYINAFTNDELIGALVNSLVLAVLSSVIATVLGTVAAYGIHRLKSKFVKSTIMTVTNVPMTNPDIITGISMMLLFVLIGGLLKIESPLGFSTMLIAHITFNLPYVIMNVLPKFRQIDIRQIEAALDLGCTPSKAFFKITLPSVMPGIISGLLMAFTLSLDDFIISYFIKPVGFDTLPLVIYSKTKHGLRPDMYALYSVIFVVILVLLIVTNVMQAKSEERNAAKLKR